MNANEPLPERLAALPVCPRRRLPVPYANVITGEGTVDFAALDSTKVQHIARHRLCGICGQPLDYWIVFLGGPRCADSRAYLDPPMHHDCARHALQLCPYLARETMQRRKTPISEATTPPGFIDDKPAAYLMYVTRSYTYTVAPDGVIFRPAPAVRIEHCHYTDGHLTPPDTT
jgi:hypothetical protein